MSYTFERHYTEKYEIENIRKNFMNFGEFNKVRMDILSCQICNQPFNNDDSTNLAFIKGKKNHLICDSCTNKALEGGATEI